MHSLNVGPHYMTAYNSSGKLRQIFMIALRAAHPPSLRGRVQRKWVTHDMQENMAELAWYYIVSTTHWLRVRRCLRCKGHEGLCDSYKWSCLRLGIVVFRLDPRPGFSLGPRRRSRSDRAPHLRGAPIKGPLRPVPTWVHKVYMRATLSVHEGACSRSSF